MLRIRGRVGWRFPPGAMSERLSLRLLVYPSGLPAVLLRPTDASQTPIIRRPVSPHVRLSGGSIRDRSVDQSALIVCTQFRDHGLLVRDDYPAKTIAQNRWLQMVVNADRLLRSGSLDLSMLGCAVVEQRE